MKLLYKSEIEDIKKSGYLKSDISITDALIENFYEEILTLEEKKLLKLAFKNNPSQEELDEVLKLWDIEVKGANKSLLLSYVLKRHPDLKFSSYEGPRLKGLLKFFRFQNMKVISHFVKITKVLNDNNIIPVILKGGAMRHLVKDLPRVMGDVDILVLEKDFYKAIKLALPLGYYFEKIDVHSVDLHDDKTKENTLDIHKFIYFKTGKPKAFLKDLFKRASLQNVFGVKAYVPSDEDMVFIILVNLARNLRDKTSLGGLIYSLFDCKYFLENNKNFNWEIVKENAKKTKTQIQMNFAMKFINKISCDIFPLEFQKEALFEEKTNNYSNTVMYERFYLEDIREKSRNLKIKEIFKDLSKFKQYLKIKPLYFSLKLLRGHPLLIKFFIKDLKTKQYDF